MMSDDFSHIREPKLLISLPMSDVSDVKCGLVVEIKKFYGTSPFLSLRQNRGVTSDTSDRVLNLLFDNALRCLMF